MLTVSVRPQREGDSIFELEDKTIVNKGPSVDYADNHVYHQIAAAPPDAKLSFSPMDSIRGAPHVGFSIEQEGPRAVIHGMDKRAGDTLPVNGIIFQLG